MTETLKTRPPLTPMLFPNIPKSETILRIEMIRAKNIWYMRPFIGKYKTKLLALTKKGVYDITQHLD